MSIQAITQAMAVRDVSSSEKLLLIALANYADEHGCCYPSQRRLSADTCLSDRRVRALLAALEERGFLDRAERTRADGSRGTDLIRLHLPAQISGGAEMVSGGVRKSFPGGAEMVSGLTTFEPSVEPSIEPIEAQAPAPKADARLGTRLPEDWFPSQLDIDGSAFMTAEARERELEKFRDYWRAVPGAKGRKLDWDATWRNWLRRAEENQPRFRKANDRPDHHTTAGSAREESLRNMYAGAMAAIDERRRDVG